MGDTKFRQSGRRTRQGPYARDAKAARREAGEVRNAVWRELTPHQQFEEVLTRRGKSKRQVTKLRRVIGEVQV